MDAAEGPPLTCCSCLQTLVGRKPLQPALEVDKEQATHNPVSGNEAAMRTCTGAFLEDVARCATAALA